MRALPLTDNARPGGRPRRKRAARNAFADWLASCGMTPTQVAGQLGTAVSSVYNMRNGYFTPGRDLALKVEQVSHGVVTVESWKPSKKGSR